MTLTGTATIATITSRTWDGPIEQTTTGCVYVLRHELTRFKPEPGEPTAEHLTKAVFWSKQAARVYVKAEYGFGDDEWVDGEPSGGFDFIITINDREQLMLSLDRTDLIW